MALVVVRALLVAVDFFRCVFAVDLLRRRAVVFFAGAFLTAVFFLLAVVLRTGALRTLFLLDAFFLAELGLFLAEAATFFVLVFFRTLEAALLDAAVFRDVFLEDWAVFARETFFFVFVFRAVCVFFLEAICSRHPELPGCFEAAG